MNEFTTLFLKFLLVFFLINVKQWIKNTAFYNTHETINLGDLILTSLPAGIFQDLSAYTEGDRIAFKTDEMDDLNKMHKVLFSFWGGMSSKEMVN